MLGRTLGHYEITASLGAGGMGEVWRARDTKLGRDVAVKILPVEMASAERVERFRREARAAAALNHPNIVTIHSVEEQDGVHFLTMELLEGESLDRLIPEGGMGLTEFLAIALPLADAVAAAHEKGVTHRDLKPSNVMVTGKSLPKVLDFGLAKVLREVEAASELPTEEKTREGVVLGTAPYMSPEQVEGRQVDHRTDIFSLGVLFYEMASGERPFGGSSRAALFSSILRDRPRPLREERLWRVVERCLEKRADERYQTAEEVLAALRQGVETVPSPGRIPLVGREEELSELERLLERGTGGMALLGGEPGVGKTRLAEEVLRAARGRNFLALSGHCYEEGGAPFVPFVEILEGMGRSLPASRLQSALGDVAAEAARLAPSLKSVLRDLPPPVELPQELRQRYLFNGLLEFLRKLCEERPVVLLLDDLHWADETSLSFVEHLAGHLESIRLVLLGTYRDVELEVGKPFEKTLATLVRKRLAERIALKRLSRQGVTALLEALGGTKPPEALVEAIHEETEGNPFFVEEVFQHLSEEGKLFDEEGAWKPDLKIDELDVPEGVRLVIGRRLSRLSEATPRVLTTASLLGPRFSFDVLEALHEDALDALEEAQSAKLLEIIPGREVVYGFSHELIRQTLVSALSLPRRQRLHLKIAEAIETVRGSRVSELAHHLYLAGSAAEVEKTIRYLELAGVQALETGASEEGLQLFERALGLLEDGGEPHAKKAELLEHRAHAERGLGRFEAVESDLRSALELYEKHRNPGGVARVAAELTLSFLWSSRWAEARGFAERGLASVAPEDSKERCRILSALAICCSVEAKPREAELGFTEAVAMARRLGDDRLLAEALRDESYLYIDNLLTARLLDAVPKSVAFQRSIPAQWELSNTLTLLRMGWAFRGRFEEVEQLAREADPLASRYGDVGAEFARYMTNSMRELAKGNPSAYLEQIEKAIELCRRSGIPISMVHGGRARGLLWLGRAREAREAVEKGLSLHDEWGCWRGTTESIHFVIRASAGEREALSFLDETGLLPEASPLNCDGAWYCLTGAVEGLALLGERTRAGELYPLTLEFLKTGTRLIWFGLVERYAAIAAACARRFPEAEQHFETALQEAESIPHRLEQAEVRRWYAWMLLARDSGGDRERARTFLAEARAIYEKMGMSTHVEISNALLRTA